MRIYDPANISLYRPVFVGYTETGDKVVIYRDWHDNLHIKYEAGELQALGPELEYHTVYDLDTDAFRLFLSSPQWTGHAVGTRADLIQQEGIA